MRWFSPLLELHQLRGAAEGHMQREALVMALMQARGQHSTPTPPQTTVPNCLKQTSAFAATLSLQEEPT